MAEVVRLRPRRRKRAEAPAGPGEVVPFRRPRPRVVQIDARPGYAARLAQIDGILARLEAMLAKWEVAG